MVVVVVVMLQQAGLAWPAWPAIVPPEHLLNCRCVSPRVGQPSISQEGQQNSLHAPPRFRGPFRKNDVFNCPMPMATFLQGADHRCSFHIKLRAKPNKMFNIPDVPAEGTKRGSVPPSLDDYLTDLRLCLWF